VKTFNASAQKTRGQRDITVELGLVLLASGSLITARIKEQLKNRNVRSVALHPDDFAHAVEKTSPGVTRLAQTITQAIATDTEIQSKIDAIAQTVSFIVENTGQAIREKVVSLGRGAYDREQKTRLVTHFNAATTLFCTF